MFGITANPYFKIYQIYHTLFSEKPWFSPVQTPLDFGVDTTTPLQFGWGPGLARVLKTLTFRPFRQEMFSWYLCGFKIISRDRPFVAFATTTMVATERARLWQTLTPSCGFPVGIGIRIRIWSWRDATSHQPPGWQFFTVTARTRKEISLGKVCGL